MLPERFGQLDESTLTDEQRRARKAILAGPRGAMVGPFKALLHSPGLFDAVKKLGAHVRFCSALPPVLTELAILVTARHWIAPFEWHMHAELALKAGLPPAVVAAISVGLRPSAMSEEQAAVHDFARSLLRMRGDNQGECRIASSRNAPEPRLGCLTRLLP
jgi:4-carboxymuconolactone decarboxylase